ncbi:MAG: hypothetical protein V8R64_00760 [Thomasclavelia sp.]
MNVISKYFNEYKNNLSGFKQFHNEVINMPRDQFSDTGLNKVRIIAGYLLLTENVTAYEGNSYKEIMDIIHIEILNHNYPKHRDLAIEKRYFQYESIDIHYETEGRMFRHLMGMASFFGFISSKSKNKKIINYDKCKEYYLSDDKVLIPIARNNIIMMNARDNDYLKSLKGISIDPDTDYRPAFSILKYMQLIERPVTKFELSILLGRIDRIKNQQNILYRALEIGRILPKTSTEQQFYFFANMGWKHSDGKFYMYANSQNPDFKFNNFLILLEEFELIQKYNSSERYILTDYALSIISDDISYLIADLERLIEIVEKSSVDKELNDIILYQRNPELLQLAKSDPEFIFKMNQRSLQHPKYDQNGKRVRNRLIAELAKIMADYKCQYAMRHIFKMENGKFYCESHHLIEFSTENGPDITNNLIVLGPEAHMILHHACKEEKNNVYMQLIRNGCLKYKQFEEMITIYHCLDKQHISILKNKNIITKDEEYNLLKLLKNN